MPIQKLASANELPQLIKNCGEDDVLLVIFDAPGQSGAETYLSAVESVLTKNPALQAVLLDVTKPDGLAIMRQMRLQGVPSTLVMKGGKSVDLLEGIMDENTLLGALEPYLPPPPAAQSLQEELDLALENGETKRALALLPLLRAEKKEDRTLWLLQLKLLWQEGLFEEAKKVLEATENNAWLSDKENLLLFFGEILDQKISENAAWEEIKNLLRNAAVTELLEALLSFIARDRKFQNDLARKVLLALLALLGDTNPDAAAARRRLANLLFI